jgi:uncharacterized phiE125 gp8 family phage protein
MRWKELTAAAQLPVSISTAKSAIRVVDTQSVATKANRTIGTGSSELFITAKIAGTIGNQYSVELLVSGNNTPLSVSVTNNKLTINSATNGSATATSTVNDVIAEIYANAQASSLFDATNGSGNGTGVVVAAANANLSSGVDGGDEDAYISLLISATAELIERITNKILMQRTHRIFYDDWPNGDIITLPLSPIQSLDALKYINSNGTLTSFTGMTLDGEDKDLPPRLILNSGESYPALAMSVLNGVQIDVTTGYGSTESSIPFVMRQAILFLVGHWYANREPVINGISVLSNKIPYTFESTLNSFRLIYV